MGEIEMVTVVRASGKHSNIRKSDYDPAKHVLLGSPAAPVAAPPAPPIPEAAPEPTKRSCGGRRVKGQGRG